MATHRVRPVSVSAEVNAPPNRVLSYISDTRNDPEWCSNVERVELLTDGDVTVGSRFRYTQHLDRPGAARVTFDGETEIVELTDSSITWSVSDKFQERSITCTVEASGSGSRVTQITEASFRRPPGIAKYLYPLLARRTLRDQLRQLAAHFSPTA